MRQKVLFRHCDPAGIVFYPRYFEMMNDCIEAFFEQVLKLPFSTLHKTGAVPTAAISTRFSALSRLGEDLNFTLRVNRLGRSSMALHICAQSGAETRFDTESILVLVNEKGRPRPWPEAVRQDINEYLENNNDE